MRLPLRKSPWTIVRRDEAGRRSRSHLSARSKVGCGWPKALYTCRVLLQRVVVGKIGHHVQRAWNGWRRGSHRTDAPSAGAPPRTRLHARCDGRSSRRRHGSSRCTARRYRRRRLRRWRQPLAPARRPSAAARSSTASRAEAAGYRARRVLAQDEGALRTVDGRGERPRLTAGAARESAQAVDRRCAENRAERVAEIGRAQQ